MTVGNQLDFVMDAGATYSVLNTQFSKLSSETISNWGVRRNLQKAFSPTARLSDGAYLSVRDLQTKYQGYLYTWMNGH